MAKLHAILPQTLTKENLAAWLTDNAIETKEHEEKFDLTPEEIAQFEHDSAAASIEIDKLDVVSELFKTFTKKGTPFDNIKQIHDEVKITIPPSKGYDVLKANREYAGAQITLGYRVEKTMLYAIPFPEMKKILFFDSEGNEWEQHGYKMNPMQLQKYDMPLMTSMGKKGKAKAPRFDEEAIDSSSDQSDLPF